MKFQTLDRLAKTKANYKLCMSGRSTGKSTDMAKKLIEKYEKKKYKFIRLVRNLNYTIDASSYFDRFTVGGEFCNNKNRIITYECYYEADGRKVPGENYTYYYNGEEFGKVLILSQSAKYKGGVYDTMYKTLVFDEYIEISMIYYLDNEYDQFMSILSTVFRLRSDVEIYLLGNNLNEDSKYNPYHIKWGIDIDRDNLKPGDLKIYKSNIFKESAKIAFEFGIIAYENENEIPLLQRVPGNEVATSGEFAKSSDIFDQDREYQNISFLTDSTNNFYMKSDNGICYYFIINTILQSFDIVKSEIDVSEIGNNGDIKKYRSLLQSKEFFIKMYGKEYYESELYKNMPYKIATPIYHNHIIYGMNLSLFVECARKKYPGYTVRYCDGNVKYLWIVTLKNRTLL